MERLVKGKCLACSDFWVCCEPDDDVREDCQANGFNAFFAGEIDTAEMNERMAFSKGGDGGV